MTIPYPPYQQYDPPQFKAPWMLSPKGTWRDQIGVTTGAILAGSFRAAKELMEDLGLNPAQWVYAEPSNTRGVQGQFIQRVIVDAATVGTVSQETIDEMNRHGAGRIRWHWVDRNVA
ncbi:Uncharacterised protein [Mycobacteroides abscessus subsp. bolletii]|nr:hypothetical protein SEA_BAUDELAIRE_102 [Mycobacterium phage Baudelaire]WKW86594.1 hypothetical protein SEA_AEGEUS_102 [Mycobacterium phage Aegeus]SIL72872.1 Uncharacterised protein [Mycobacteroides abscessus subsp. abscessus]SKT46080.1 Uncharacterised protein [Mycobacteroides abscessus subsp. bolletii]